MGCGTKLVTTAEVPEAYSRGVIGPEVAIRRIGGIGFGDLLSTMSDCEIPLPRGAGEELETEHEVAEALPLLRANLLPAAVQFGQ